MTSEENLRSARSALQRGDRQAAAAIFARLVKENPDLEEAWLGLGLALDEKERRIFCLNRALTLNPENPIARQLLLSLESSEETSPPPPITKPDQPASKKSDLLRQAVKQMAPVPKPVPAPVSPVQKLEAPAPAKLDPEPASRQKETKRKKSRGSLIWFFIIFAIVILGISALLFAFASGLFDPLLPEGLLPVNLEPTSGSFITATAQPTRAASPTLSALAPATQAPLITYSPLFEEGDCPFEPPGEGEVECGVVIVPENRRDPDTQMIRLAVAVYQATGASPKTDPVIFLQGGPGAGAVSLSAVAYTVLVEPFLEDHTFITFDQRGTGLSEPTLPCDALTQVYSQDIRKLIEPSSRDLIYQTAFRSCHDLLSFEDIDLTTYTTLENAADVKDVLQALDHPRADLFAVSYGTRLGQVVMREYPEIVRSAVLDSMLPLEVNVYTSSAQTSKIALRTLFDGCADDPTCAAAFPTLEDDFWTLVEEMDAEPISIPVMVPYAGGRSYVTVDGKQYLSQVIASLKQTWMIAGIPLAIEQVREGDTSFLSTTLGFPPVDWDLDISLGMYISIMCHEYIMDADPDALTAGLGGQFDRGDLGWFPFIGGGEDYITLCEEWDSIAPFEGEDDPLLTDIPTLVLAGKYDSITPPSFGATVADHLTNATYLEFPDQGHAPSAAMETDCPMQTILTFFDHPETGPDSSCLAEEQPPVFLVPYTGVDPINFTTLELTESEIQVDIPVDWLDMGSGVYIRGASGLDITQLVVLRVEAAPAQTLSILSERQFYGKMMLDSAPTEQGEMKSGGITWDLYGSTSFGTPVDLALANDRGSTLLVMLFAHLNERDALYDQVFKPVVTSVQSVR